LTRARRVAIWLRVSTAEQRVNSQELVVTRYVAARGWSVVRRFVEQGISGAAASRSVVDQILTAARRREFDAVVIFRGDRSFRSAGRGCLFIDELLATGCAFVSVEDGIDTGTPMGELMAKMAVLLAEWERRGIRDRVRAGMHAARSRGQHVGRPRARIDLARARALLNAGGTIRRVAAKFGVARSTLRHALTVGGEKVLSDQGA
jgi:DNA invertase Pin-like site-specific DNA recombinase